MGALEKSSSCGSLPLPKTANVIKTEQKLITNLKKFATEEGKSILKKKGKPGQVKIKIK